ncbi:MAG: DUF1566 domain-containing protein [Nitrospirae bacterium]|nr:DUF1566 domain-containing protein [Nitrospirota bacterium]
MYWQKNSLTKMKYSPYNMTFNVMVLLVLALIAVTGGVLFTGIACAGTVNLPQTGQTTSYAAADDGDLHKGAAWPNPRFTDNGDYTVTDNLTGLLWSKDAGTAATGSCKGGIKTWQEALDYVTCLNGMNHLGHSDWRLPNVNEIESLIDASMSKPSLPSGHPFTNVRTVNYWSSTTYALDTTIAWYVVIYSGDVGAVGKAGSENGYAWVVRDGKSWAFGRSFVWLSGQTKSYAAGDDGALQKGLAWPNPRFTDNGDYMVKDNLTGLFWTKDAGTPTRDACTGGVKTWQGALDYVACLNSAKYAGKSHWRLPNRKELRSLFDYGTSNPALSSGNIFANAQTANYWSSTTCSDVSAASGAWSVFMKDGSVSVGNKDGSYYYVLATHDGYNRRAKSDFDGDGHSDVLWHNSATGDVYIWFMDGKTITGGSFVVKGIPADWNIKGVGDFNGDSKADVLWQNAAGDVYIWLMDGVTIKTGGYVVKGMPPQWKVAALGDFNGDGKADIMWGNTASGDVYVWLMDGASKTDGDYVARGIPLEWVVKAVADINGDGNSDILWQNTTTGDIAGWLMGGIVISIGNYVAKAVPSAWQMKAVEDFDGDDRADILWQDTATGDVAIWFMNGLGIVKSGYVVKNVSAPWQFQTTADYNGDGKTDMLWRNTTTGDVYLHTLDGLNITGGGYVTLGLPNDWQPK